MLKVIPPQIETKLFKKYNISANEFANSLCLMAFTLAECWRGKVPTGKNLDHFMICLKKPLFYMCFPKLLQAFRKINVFSVTEAGMDELIHSISICLTLSKKNSNVAIPLELINLSSTYYTFKETLDHSEVNRDRIQTSLPLNSQKTEILGQNKVIDEYTH
jgi:hypothetical protein